MKSILSILVLLLAVFQWGWFGAVFGVHDPELAGAQLLADDLDRRAVRSGDGLSVVYHLGVRQAHVHGKSSRDAINYGVHLSRAVVIAAAIVVDLRVRWFCFLAHGHDPTYRLRAGV